MAGFALLCLSLLVLAAISILQSVIFSPICVNVLLQIARYRSGDVSCLGICLADVL